MEEREEREIWAAGVVLAAKREAKAVAAASAVERVRATAVLEVAMGAVKDSAGSVQWPLGAAAAVCKRHRPGRTRWNRR